MSRFEERGRSRHDRDLSPDYTYAGGSNSNAQYRVPSPGHTTYYPPSNSQARLDYEPQTPFYAPPPNSNNTLQIPDSRARPRSLPPIDADDRRSRSRSRHHDPDPASRERDIERDRSPLARARNALGNTFTDSTTGLGVGVLGALVGGLAAREAVDATGSRHHRHGHSPETQRRNQILGAVVGAAVGALGANAVERRLELGRERDRVDQRRLEQRWGRPGSRGSGVSGADGPVFEGGRRGSAEVVERREVTVRPGGASRREHWHWENDSGSGGGGGDSPIRKGVGGKGRGLEREVDPDARSWRDVEDWVYDDRDRDRERSRERRGRRSLDAYRY